MAKTCLARFTAMSPTSRCRSGCAPCSRALRPAAGASGKPAQLRHFVFSPFRLAFASGAAPVVTGRASGRDRPMASITADQRTQRGGPGKPAVHHQRLFGRHADRVVRFLPVRRSCRLFQQAFLLAGDGPEPGVHPESRGVLDRLPGAPVWRDRVRPSRRSGRPQIHLHADAAADGGLDLCRRPAAGFRHPRLRWRRFSSC